MSKLSKTFRVILSFTALLFVSFSFFAGKIYADAKPVPQLHLPCDKTKDPEFHSDRPYQAAPCGDADKALFCSNSLQFVETFKNFPECNSQAPGGEGKFLCNVNRYIPDHTLIVNLADAQLPIMGNTELVKNSQSSAESLDDATKVSDYASWYLNGTLNKAEYGQPDMPVNSDFAGVIQKIMPSIILDAQRAKTVSLVSTKVDSAPDDNTGKTTQEPANHDQVVVCGNSNIPLIGNLLHLGTLTPTECYDGNGSGPNGQHLRLSDWNGDLSFWNSGINTIVSGLTSLFPGVAASVIQDSVGKHWNSRLPPLPWDDKGDGTGKPFTADYLYQKAYNEWRGKTCVIIPILNTVVCVDNVFVPNQYADLFHYVPLANTADAHGAEFTMTTIIRAEGETEITDSSYDLPTPAPLYFAHTNDAKELSGFLNKSYNPLECKTAGGKQTCKPLANAPVPASTDSPDCRIVDVRSNPGDNLFAGQPHGLEVPGVHYTITQVPCEVKEEWVNYPPPAHLKRSISCDAEIALTIPTVIKSPSADPIWENTTANSGSTFRRIYPKVENGAPVSCIADIPAETSVTYTPIDPVGNGDQNFKVIGPTGGNTTDDPKLYFPHLGSVYDYFLNGIQQALRPQGYGPGQPQSGQYCSNISCGELPKNLPKGTGSCALGGISSRVGKIPQSLKDIIEAAAQTYKVPPNLLLGVMFGEGLFNPGRFNWTDENVKNWATCSKIPNCNESGDDNFMGFNGTVFQRTVPYIKADIQKLDPTRKTFSQCNLLDTIYAEAYTLHASAPGGGGLPATCFGIPLHSTIPTSCSWNDSQYEDAIKVHETGYTADCLTLENGCAIGGIAAKCPSGDTCETLSNRYSSPSHNACVWDVGHGK